MEGFNFPPQQGLNPNTRCYKCRDNEHWARNCSQAQGNLINFMNEEPSYQEPSYQEPSYQEPIKGPPTGNSYITPAKIKAAIKAMSSNEKGELASFMDTREDFPTA